MDRRKMDVRHHFEGARDSFDQTRCTKGGKGFHELFHLDLIPLKQGRINFELQRWGYKRAIDKSTIVLHNRLRTSDARHASIDDLPYRNEVKLP